MPDPWLDPVPGAPYTSRSLAHLALARAVRELILAAADLMPVGHVPEPLDGTTLTAALQVGRAARDVIECAAVVEREDGTSWEAMAEIHLLAEGPRSPAVDETVVRSIVAWTEAVRKWHRDVELAGYAHHLASASTRLGIGIPEELLVDPVAFAEDLDAWVQDQSLFATPDPLDRPSIHARLELMDPLRELLHLAALRRRIGRIRRRKNSRLDHYIATRADSINRIVGSLQDDEPPQQDEEPALRHVSRPPSGLSSFPETNP